MHEILRYKKNIQQDNNNKIVFILICKLIIVGFFAP